MLSPESRRAGSYGDAHEEQSAATLPRVALVNFEGALIEFASSALRAAEIPVTQANVLSMIHDLNEQKFGRRGTAKRIQTMRGWPINPGMTGGGDLDNLKMLLNFSEIDQLDSIFERKLESIKSRVEVIISERLSRDTRVKEIRTVRHKIRLSQASVPQRVQNTLHWGRGYTELLDLEHGDNDLGDIREKMRIAMDEVIRKQEWLPLINAYKKATERLSIFCITH